MAQSIRKRLDGNIPQFIEDVKRDGRWEAMRRWGLEKSYLPVAKIILEETGDENYGLNPTASSYLNQGIRGLLREVVVAFADYVIREDRKNEALRKRLETYETNGNSLERSFVDDMLELLGALKSVEA